MTRTESDGARAQYFAWLHDHEHESSDASAVWAAAWRAGAWDAIRRNTTLGLNLSQVIQRLEELAVLYGDQLHDVEQERALGSAYWRSPEP